MDDHGALISKTLTQELTDKRKETHNHLSAVEGKHSWIKCTEEDKQAGLGLHANNNISESSFGTLTHFVNAFKTIGSANAGMWL